MPISLFEEGQPNKGLFYFRVDYERANLFVGWFKLQSYKKYKGKGEIFMEITYTTQNKVNLYFDVFLLSK